MDDDDDNDNDDDDDNNDNDDDDDDDDDNDSGNGGDDDDYYYGPFRKHYWRGGGFWGRVSRFCHSSKGAPRFFQSYKVGCPDFVKF